MLLFNYLDTLPKLYQIPLILSCCITEEDLIRKQAGNLEKVKEMSNVLGSEHIKNVTSLEGQLAELSKVHIQQQVPAYKNLMFNAINP